MGRLDLERLWRDIYCLYPFYADDGGNYTKILLKGGKEVVDKRKTKTVLRELANFFTVDLKSVRVKYSAYIDRKKAIPIPFHGDLIMISVKAREPQFKDEGAVAYLNTQEIDSVKDLRTMGGPKTQIIFRDQTTIKVFQTAQTVKALLKDADIIRTSFLKLYSSGHHKDLILKERLSSFLELMNEIN